MPKFNPLSEFKFDRPADVQVTSLIYAMGSEVEQIFNSFTFNEETDKTSMK